MSDDDVRIELDRNKINRFRGGDALETLMDAGEQVARYAQLGAPKRTGAGAASIGAVPGEDRRGAYVDVSWDDAHFYMIFAEDGTKYRSATPFLRPAIDRYMRM